MSAISDEPLKSTPTPETATFPELPETVTSRWTTGTSPEPRTTSPATPGETEIPPTSIFTASSDVTDITQPFNVEAVA